MDDSLPASDELRTVQTGDGVRFILPRMRGCGAVGAGVFLLGFGCFFSGFAVVWMLGAAGVLEGSGSTPGILQLLFAAFGLPFVVVGMMPVFLGLRVLLGHSEIELTHHQFAVIECVGFIRWPRRRPIESLRRLKLARSAADPTDGANAGPQAGSAIAAAALQAEFDGHKPLRFGHGLKMRALELLAEELAREHKLITGLSLAPGQAKEVEIVTAIETESVGPYPGDAEAAATGAAAPAIPPKPVNTPITYEPHASGATLHVPRLGFASSAAAGIVFGVIWSGITGSIMTIILIADAAPWPVMIGLGAFVLIGVAILLTSIAAARRSAIIDIVHGTLVFTRQGLTGTRQQEWRRDQISGVTTQVSVTINDKPYYNVSLKLVDGPGVTLVHSRETEEAHWVAALLRQALK